MKTDQKVSIETIYESPAMNVVELNAEGVLCVSGNFEEWNEETLEW